MHDNPFNHEARHRFRPGTRIAMRRLSGVPHPGKDRKMATQPDVPQPDTINPQSPPDSPPIETPEEAPPQPEGPELPPQQPDHDQPSRGTPEIAPPPD